MISNIPITKELVISLKNIIAAGLCKGVGSHVPGQMCVEAAVCFAYNFPQSDNPPCVGSAVRSYKIALNDSAWSSNAARASGMKEIAIAQLNSNLLVQEEFSNRIIIVTYNTIIADLAMKYLPEIEIRFREVQQLQIGRELCLKLKKVVDNAVANAFASSYNVAAATAAAAAVNFAIKAAVMHRVHNMADAASDAATAVRYAAISYAEAEAIKYADEILNQGAHNCLTVLKDMKSEGCDYLYLLENEV